MSKSTHSLADLYDLSITRLFLTGPQAILRMMLMQSERDRQAGLDTAGYVSGYRGSPVGTVDNQFVAARKVLEIQRADTLRSLAAAPGTARAQGRDGLRNGEIVAILDSWQLPSQEVHAVYPSPRLVPAKVQEVVSWLKGRFTDNWWRSDVRVLNHNQN